MSNLLSLLGQTAVNLNVQQTVTATASNNISNASNPNYSRQVTNLASLPAEQEGNSFIGEGVTVQSVTQIRSQFIEAQMPSAFGSSSSATSAASTLTAVTSLDPSATGGLASQLGNYYSALQALAQNPGDASLRQAAVAAAQALTTAFNQTSQSITGAQNGVDSQLPSLATQVNSLTSQMASLNAQIRMDEASGAQPNDLLDQRQSIQDQLEQLTGAVPIADGTGEVDMALPDGTSLVSGDTASTMSTQVDAANGGHLDILLTPPGGSALTIPTSDLGGTIGGLVSARDGALATALSSLDSMAFDLGNASNAVQTAGFDINGNPGVDLFNVGTSAPGTAGTISVNSAIVANPGLIAAASTATGGAGDATNLQNLIATQTSNLATSGQTPVETLANLTTNYGAQTQQAQNGQTQTGAVLQNLQQMRSSVSGVSIDAETTTIDQAQNVYQALSKVITATDTMLQSLLAIQ
jgi:flagellar hook-associated protein 1 FlgK